MSEPSSPYVPLTSSATSPVASSSTPATSPPPEDEAEGKGLFDGAWKEEEEDGVKDEELGAKMAGIEDMPLDERYTRLNALLEKSAAYATLLKQRMDMAKTRVLEGSPTPPPSPPAPKSKSKSKAKGKGKGRKRARPEEEEEGEGEGEAKRARVEREGGGGGDEGGKFAQPALVTGARLKDYQLEGVAWMVGLFENGISGILADEMGLGKTLQTIAFSAWLRDKISGPFLVVCPLSVLHNWIAEYQRFAPDIPVCMYHGAPAERAELRCTVLVPPMGAEGPDFATNPRGNPKGRAKKGKGPAKKGKKGKSRRGKKVEEDNEVEVEGGEENMQVEEEGEEAAAPLKGEWGNFPVVVTTYEMLIRDQKYLSQYKWGFIVVDEGQRLKNMDCRLMQEIKRYESAGRIVLTGTPLQNNLAELWSLLNFILPELFDNLDSFQQWFNLSNLQDHMSAERAESIISSLHAILKPFLLRRTKADVEVGLNLPPKKEYVVYVGLSERQRELYEAIVEGGLRKLLVQKKSKESGAGEVKVDEGEGRKLRSAKGKKGQDKENKRKRKGKAVEKFDILDGDDDEYFERLERGEFEEEEWKRMQTKKSEDGGREWQLKSALRQVNNLRLQNIIMQLRKACSHPYLFDWPLDPHTHAPTTSADIVAASSKMMLLERLLDALFAEGHRVLLFSQFTRMLDVIEAWATEGRGWEVCRIDGGTAPEARREEVERFQKAEEGGPKLFLLSTRAGGLGINLTAADTVIFYDQDWNPQMDIQAQDRAHRIGQTKPVLIFRMVTQNTIEGRIMQRASAKRQLEALVIAKGKYKNPTAAPTAAGTTLTELAANMLEIEGSRVDTANPSSAQTIISDEELEMLLDRSPEVFEERGSGWNSKGGEKKGAKFAVFSGSVEGGSETLAGMLGEKEG